MPLLTDNLTTTLNYFVSMFWLELNFVVDSSLFNTSWISIAFIQSYQVFILRTMLLFFFKCRDDNLVTPVNSLH